MVSWLGGGMPKGIKTAPLKLPKRVPTSIKIDPELWKEAKIEAIRHDMTLSELVEEAIREWIRRHREGGESERK